MTVIRIAAAVIVDDAGRWLLVRKRGTTSWMQPGGKLEDGESAAECLARELEEELGIHDLELVPLGRFSAEAANEPDHTVDCDVFLVPRPFTGEVSAMAELHEAAWFAREALVSLGPDLAPLSRLLISTGSIGDRLSIGDQL